jgi:hypothetical protein
VCCHLNLLQYAAARLICHVNIFAIVQMHSLTVLLYRCNIWMYIMVLLSKCAIEYMVAQVNVAKSVESPVGPVSPGSVNHVCDATSC